MRTGSEVLRKARVALEHQAETWEALGEGYFARHPGVEGQSGVEHSDGATYRRLAGVYEGAAQGVGELELKLQRELVRASNLYYRDLSDAEIDTIIKESGDDVLGLMVDV